MKQRQLHTLHPLLVAAYPVLFLYTANLSELELAELWLPLVVVVTTSALIWLGLSRLLRDPMRAALLTSVGWLWFFSYGHAAGYLLPRLGIQGLGGERLFLAGWVLLLMVVALVAIRQRRMQAAQLSRPIYYFALVLLALPLLNAGTYAVRLARVSPLPGAPVPRAARAESRPNIYYLVLDGYGRQDVLQQLYGFDNSHFLRYLRRQGFFVADRAAANYGQTALSLASALNMGYLDRLADRVGQDSQDREILKKYVGAGQVPTFLRAQGYRILSFPAGFAAMGLEHAHNRRTPLRPQELRATLLAHSPLAPVLRSLRRYQWHEHRQSILDTFAHLPVPSRSGQPV